MSLTQFTTDISYISALPDSPTPNGGFTKTQLKTEFDKAGNALKTFINETMITELDILIQTLNDSGTKKQIDDTLIDANDNTYPSLSSRLNSIDTKIKELKHIDEFPLIAPETNDTGRFQRAVNSGYNIILGHNASYTVDTVRFMTSGVKVFGNGAIITASTTTSNCFYIGRNESNAFVKVTDIEIENITFIGIQSSYATAYTSTAINIKEGSTIARNSGCENIKVNNCKFSKFTYDIIGTSVTGLEVKESYFTNNYYNQPDSAGGYGVLIQSCFDVHIHHNKFKGLAGDRHAIYLSCVPATTVQNENVSVYDNTIDWTEVLDITGFESCIVVRSNKKLHLKDNKLYGGFGGIRVLASNGDSSDLVISRNIIKDIRKKNSNMGGIDLLSDAYSIDNVLITDNVISNTLTGVWGITINLGTNVSVKNNKIKALETGCYVFNTSKLDIVNNNFNDCSDAAIEYTGTLDSINIGANFFNITGLQEKVTETCTMSNIYHSYERYAKIRSASSTLSIMSNPNNLISEIVTDSVGVKVTFNKSFIPYNGIVIAQAIGGTPYFITNKIVDVANNAVTFQIMDITGATKDYSTITLDIMLFVSQ